MQNVCNVEKVQWQMAGLRLIRPRVFPRRFTDGGLPISYCLRTIGYCFPEIFVGGARP